MCISTGNDYRFQRIGFVALWETIFCAGVSGRIVCQQVQSSVIYYTRNYGRLAVRSVWGKYMQKFKLTDKRFRKYTNACWALCRQVVVNTVNFISDSVEDQLSVSHGF